MNAQTGSSLVVFRGSEQIEFVSLVHYPFPLVRFMPSEPGHELRFVSMMQEEMVTGAQANQVPFFKQKVRERPTP